MTEVIIPSNDGGWTLAEAVTGHVDRLLLYGPPGTGKSFHAQTGAEKGFYRVYLTEDTPMFELRGGPTLPEGVWQDGPCIRAWREGKRLILDEIDKAPTEAMSFLLGVLDDPATAVMTLPHGETVRPAPGFHCIATTNGGPDDLMEALKDRFTVAVEIDQPHKAAIDSLPKDLRQAARASAKAEGHRRVSIRGWACFADLRTKIGEDAAAQAVFGERHQDVLDAFRVVSLKKAEKPKAESSLHVGGTRIATKVMGECGWHAATGTPGIPAYVAISELGASAHHTYDKDKVGFLTCDSCMASLVSGDRVGKVVNSLGKTVALDCWKTGGKYDPSREGYLIKRTTAAVV